MTSSASTACMTVDFDLSFQPTLVKKDKMSVFNAGWGRKTGSSFLACTR